MDTTVNTNTTVVNWAKYQCEKVLEYGKVAMQKGRKGAGIKSRNGCKCCEHDTWYLIEAFEVVHDGLLGDNPLLHLLHINIVPFHRVTDVVQSR